MQLPKLTPLQSRLLASVIATTVLVGIWFGFQPRSFVYAAEITSAQEDAGHAQFGQATRPDELDTLGDPEEWIRLGESGERGEDWTRSDPGEGKVEEGGYVGDFTYFDRSLTGRAEEPVGEMVINQVDEVDLVPGGTKNFVLRKAQFMAKRGEEEEELENVEGREVENSSKRGTEGGFEHWEDEQSEGQEAGIQKRQSGKKIYVSVTTCRQPKPLNIATDDPSQLTLYISNDTRNQKPGPDSKEHLATPPISFTEGYASYSLQSTSDVFIGVDAPGLSEGWSGGYHFQIAVSTDDWYHKVGDEHSFAYKVDADSGSALFITHKITSNTDSVDKWKAVQGERIPFRMYAFENATWGATGLKRSFCGLQEAFNARNDSINIVTSMIAQYGEPLPKAQFHVQSLKANTAYTGVVVMAGNIPLDGLDMENMTIAKGGQVWRQFNWTTKDDDTCQVIFDLDFCSEIAYAVPSSLEYKGKPAALAKKYDDWASSLMQNFTNSLAQVPCNTTDTAQYSLASTCTDCRDSYKKWLCAVLMPRCEPFSTDSTNRPELVERNVGSPFPSNNTYAYPDDDPRRLRFATAKSRNPFIDDQIKPGPYKELLPCNDLCFDLVRTCPAQLGFSCPNWPAMNSTYAKRDSDSEELKCNFPGAVVNLNIKTGSAGTKVALIGRAVSVAVMAGILLWP